ncbi:NETI motif-containing protein [Alteribacillus bidgolensis]|uniref:NETI protein n=1 Tax=Alteribacillus bidgolensis TaxID=930129 RepID=A0A1G8KB03_9BACI|nr:NETI motif-containing protein [Alteribacillus bidgolensis]SDI40625.1 NETI protein [Alteribacillus bidgolensis]
MPKKTKRKKFEVKDGETIDECLKRIDEEGYVPVRRMEKPVFEEVRKNGKTEKIPIKQQILFETKLK